MFLESPRFPAVLFLAVAWNKRAQTKRPAVSPALVATP
jgi:hypothetical protein